MTKIIRLDEVLDSRKYERAIEAHSRHAKFSYFVSRKIMSSPSF